MLVSPTEPKPICEIGSVSLLPESYGADIMWAVQGGWVGVQRKEIGDLLASTGDGRLAMQVGQMQRLSLAVIMVEGKPRWTTDGVMLGRDYGQQWTRDSYRALLWSVRKRGIWVEETDSITDTIAAIHSLVHWCAKVKHTSTGRRPGPQSAWGKADNRDFGLHLLMGLPGIGPEMAGVIYDTFGGVPWRWDVEKTELLGIRGLGKKKVDAMFGAIGRKDQE